MTRTSEGTYTVDAIFPRTWKGWNVWAESGLDALNQVEKMAQDWAKENINDPKDRTFRLEIVVRP